MKRFFTMLLFMIVMGPVWLWCKIFGKKMPFNFG
jgi:hypothetical protein